MQPKKQKYITRIEQKGYVSYWVRFWSSGNRAPKTEDEKFRHTLNKVFRDKKDADGMTAYRRAVRYRNKIMRDYPDLIPTGKPNALYKKFRRRTKATKQAQAGVHRVHRVGRSPQFLATWQEGERGERRARSKAFGYKEDDFDDEQRAYRAARRHRKQMEKLHYTGAY